MTSFTQQFDEALKRISALSRAVAKNTVVGVGESLVYKSPYGEPEMWSEEWRLARPGYAPGNFRGSWHHNVGSPSSDETNHVDAQGDSSLSEIRAGAEASPVGVHYINNSAKDKDGAYYGLKMERGYAWHARTVQPVAHAMVELTAIEFPQIVKVAVEKAKVSRGH